MNWKISTRTVSNLTLFITLTFQVSAQSPRPALFQEACQMISASTLRPEPGQEHEDGPWNMARRWEAFMHQRTFPSGEIPDAEILYREYYKWKENQSTESIDAANWMFVGPHQVPASGGGSGRLNCVALDPNNTNTIWVGAACGGLWKSTDGGQTWNVSGTDQLPSLSISDIAIDPVNTQNMYLATGDKYGIHYMLQTWGHYSAGVLKSTDGGQTWNPTGLNYAMASVALLQRLVIDHANPQHLVAAAMNGLFRTTDGGTTWTNVKSGKFYDVEIHPSNPSIWYAADSTKIYRSQDGGQTWNPTGITASGRSSITVSKGFPNVVYIWVNGSLYYSGDSGNSFAFRNSPSNACNPVGYYDMVLEVSHGDENVLIAGGVEVALSVDGGQTWTQVSTTPPSTAPNYIHADQKAFAFAPNSSTTAYLCNDGGLFKTTNRCTSFTDLSNGLDIKQYYRMSSSQQNPNVIFGGAQDNGSDKINGPSSSTMVFWYDGEDCLVDYTNDNIVFVSTQGGTFKRSTNGGVSFSNTPVTGCDWTSPIVMDPNNHNIIYVGASYVRKSIDNGVTWTTLMNGVFDGGCVYSIDVAPSNSSYIYVATFGHIYRTTDGGTSWSDITGTLPVTSAAITGITVSQSDPDKVWVCFSGFSAGNKIFKTNNGGSSWTNISSGIPNVPVNCLKYQKNTPDFVYAGTDIGVFFSDTANTWSSYNNGLPATIVNDLEIYYPTMKVRAATYGRGVWESDLHDTTGTSTGILDKEDISLSVYPNPASEYLNISSSRNLELIELYDALGRAVSFHHVNAQHYRIPVIDLKGGLYVVKTRSGAISTTKIISIQRFR